MAHPYAAWTAQQMIEAVAPDVVAERVIRDRDRIFGAVFDKRVAGMGLEQDYVRCFNDDRSHMALDGDAPAGRALEGPEAGDVMSTKRPARRALDQGLSAARELFFTGAVVAGSARASPPRSRALAASDHQGEPPTMSTPFVWFHHNGKKSNETEKFLVSLLGVQATGGPGGTTMLAAGAGPFAALGSEEDRYGDRDEWIPFVAVDDVDGATKRAVGLGASLVREKTRGPAGEFTVVRDPGGAALALWKKAQA